MDKVTIGKIQNIPKTHGTYEDHEIYAQNGYVNRMRHLMGTDLR